MPPTELTPPARQIDPRGMRFGAGVSAIVLVAAWALDWPWLAVLVGVNLAISSALGIRFFLPGRPWPFVRRALALGPAEPEHEYPPRFARAMGATVIGLATIAFVVGAATLGWLLVGAVVALQTLLAVTGICVGCRMYFLRWWVPSLFASLLRRSDGRAGVGDMPKIQRLG